MKNQDKETLTKITNKIFEEFAFMFAEFIDDNMIESNSDSFTSASMSFNGPHSGNIIIVVSLGFAVQLALNTLGLDEADELEPDSPDDALKELLNTICGRMLTSIYGDEAVFDLTVPEANVINHADWEELVKTKEWIALNIDDEPVLLTAKL